MQVRSICYEELDRYSSLSSNDNAGFKDELLQWIEAGKTKLEWCFAVEDNNEFLGRIIYGIFKDEPEDLKIWDMSLSDIGCNLSCICEMLLRESISDMRQRNFKTIEYHLYSNNSSSFEECKELFIKSGFKVMQEKKSFVCSKTDINYLSDRLMFRSLGEVGEDKFICAIERVTENTLDQDDLNCVNEYGPREAAIKYFSILKEIDFNRDWWKLAYKDKTEFVGLIVPQKFNDDIGAINYIGVDPEKRGNAYGSELLREGTKTLFNNGIKQIIADIDISNFPMENILNKHGYEFDNSMVVLKMELCR